MARYGYARVSTDMQSVDAQLPALEAEKLDMIFVETVSGAVPARERPVLASLLDRLQPQDSLVVVRLDRLGRDAIDMLQLVSALDERNVRVRILSLGIETGTANGRMFLTILMAIAEFERELIRERTRAGIAAARAAGRGWTAAGRAILQRRCLSLTPGSVASVAGPLHLRETCQPAGGD